MTRVLVVEDEESFADPLCYMLGREGFETIQARTGPEALAAFDAGRADIVLLDLMLPGMPGTEVCRHLRARSGIPIIMLTAKDTEIDKVVGLELGADDYVTKPYAARELVARMRAVLRRHGDESKRLDQSAQSNDVVLEAGPIRMDTDRHVVDINGKPVTLALKEYQLLELLLRNVGRVLTRTQLLDRVWGVGYASNANTVDVHVKRLRAKIEPEPADPSHLLTVRGVGYRLERGAEGCAGPRRRRKRG